MSEFIEPISTSPSVILEVSGGGKKIRFKAGSDISDKVNLNIQKPTDQSLGVILELTFE